MENVISILVSASCGSQVAVIFHKMLWGGGGQPIKALGYNVLRGSGVILIAGYPRSSSANLWPPV
jgi:hypothetical protein